MKTPMLVAAALLLAAPLAAGSQYYHIEGRHIVAPAYDTNADLSPIVAAGIVAYDSIPDQPGVPPVPQWPGSPPCFDVNPTTVATPSWQAPGQDITSPSIPAFPVFPGVSFVLPSYHVPSVTYTQETGQGDPIVVQTAAYDTPSVGFTVPPVYFPGLQSQTLVAAGSASGGSYIVVYPGSHHCLTIGD